MSYTKGFLPLSVDPLTFGHVHLIQQAAAQCNELVLLVLDSDGKLNNYLFSPEERIRFLDHALRVSNIGADLRRYDRLLTDALLLEGYQPDPEKFAIFRGARTRQEREQDEQHMREHSLLLPGLLQTVHYIEPAEPFAALSSSVVKSLVSHFRNISGLVPMPVKQALEERITCQFKLAITGQLGVGKSFLAEALRRTMKLSHGLDVHLVSIDQLEKYVLAEDSLGAQCLRDHLAELFGSDILSPNRKQLRGNKLAQRVFDPECPTEHRRDIHNAIAPHIERKLAEFLQNKQGLILFEWALLAENGMSALANNNAVVVRSGHRDSFLAKRKIPPDRVIAIDALQWSLEEKTSNLISHAEADDHGTIILFDNRPEEQAAFQTSVDRLCLEILMIFPALKSLSNTLPDSSANSVA